MFTSIDLVQSKVIFAVAEHVVVVELAWRGYRPAVERSRARRSTTLASLSPFSSLSIKPNQTIDHRRHAWVTCSVNQLQVSSSRLVSSTQGLISLPMEYHFECITECFSSNADVLLVPLTTIYSSEHCRRVSQVPAISLSVSMACTSNIISKANGH